MSEYASGLKKKRNTLVSFEDPTPQGGSVGISRYNSGSYHAFSNS
jgi:hypothetical protein